MKVVGCRRPGLSMAHVLVFVGGILFVPEQGFGQKLQSMDEGLDLSKIARFETTLDATLQRATSPDGRLKVVCELRKVRVISAESDTVLHEFSTAGQSYSPVFSPDGKRVVVAVCRGNLGCLSTVVAWNLDDGERSELGECSGLVLDMNFDPGGQKLAAATWYGQIGTLALHSKFNKWLGGEIVVFGVTGSDSPLRIPCELSGVWTPKADEVQTAKSATELLRSSLASAYQKSLPIRVGLTEDGTRVVGITTEGSLQIFDAASGRSVLVMDNQGRAGSEMFAMPSAQANP